MLENIIAFLTKTALYQFNKTRGRYRGNLALDKMKVKKVLVDPRTRDIVEEIGKKDQFELLRG